MQASEASHRGCGPKRRHAFWARLSTGQRNQYISAHRNVSPELLARYHEAGIRNLPIFPREDFLFLYLESDNYDAALAALENDPSESEWQRLVGPMLKAGGFSELVELFHMA